MSCSILIFTISKNSLVAIVYYTTALEHFQKYKCEINLQTITNLSRFPINFNGYRNNKRKRSQKLFPTVYWLDCSDGSVA